MNNCTCGSVPEVKALSDDRFIVFCAACKQKGEAWGTKSGAIARWDRAQVSVRCLGCDSLPRAGFRRSDGKRNMACRGCGYYTSPSLTLDGAMVDWVRQNKKGDPHAFDRWRSRFNQLSGAANE